MYQKPSRQLDMAYDAYLRNPGAAGQVLQAAAQGAPVGLQGLAAAAAQRTAQQDQLAQAGAQRQPPAPTIIQQLAAQPGIMGQLPSNIDLAQAPVEPAPQMMAGGGLVAFSDGGNVLPPDVIDAIQSHFASGGEIRGYEDGNALWNAMDPALLDESISDIIERSKQPAREEALLSGELPVSRHPYKEEEWKRALKGAPTAERLGSPYEKLNAAYLEAFGNPTPESYGSSYISPEMWKQAGIASQLPEEVRPVKETHKDDQGKKIPEAKSWKPAPETATGTPIVPKAQVIKEGSELTPEFKAAKNDTGSAPVHEEPKAGLESLDYGAMRDLISELRGHQTMSPEIAQKLEDLQSGAKTSTIFQTLLGGLAGGLSSPYGGRFALGRAALGALGGYEKGAAGEETIDKSAFDILKGYAEAPQAEKAKAADLMLGIMGKSAEQQSEERRALARASSGLSLEDREELARYKASLGPTQYQITQAQNTQAQQDIVKQNAARDEYDDFLKHNFNSDPAFLAKTKREIYNRWGVGHLLPSEASGSAQQPSGGPIVVTRDKK